MIKRLHLHPVSISIINKKYSDHIIDGILHLSYANNLRRQIRSSPKSSNTQKYLQYIEVECDEKVSIDHLNRAGYYLYKLHMEMMIDFINILVDISKMNISVAIDHFYDYYDIDLCDFDDETAKKIYQRAKIKQNDNKVTVKKNDRLFTKESFYKKIDEAVMANIDHIFSSDTDAISIYKYRQIKYTLLRDYYKMKYFQIGKMCNAKASNIHVSIQNYKFRKIQSANKQ